SHSTFLTLFCIAMDYLPIQASSVPCECVFSSSRETNTKRHNHIIPSLMEALQMLKFFLKKDRLDFTKGWATSQKEMLMDMDDKDLLASIVAANLAGDTLTKAVDDVIGAIADGEGDETPDIPEVFQSPQCDIHDIAWTIFYAYTIHCSHWGPSSIHI
ncbi:hypothetical protein PAXRUDRAFT_147475, partial [Paxillus rubicundulus Ve08.2h10]